MRNSGKKTLVIATLAGIAYLCLPLSSAHTQTPVDPLTGTYPAEFVIGSAKVKSPDNVVFVWGSDERSATMFRRYIVPLTRKIARLGNESFRVFMLQRVLDDEIDYRGPGALLQCANAQAQYAKVATDYLLYGKNYARRTPLKLASALYANDTVEKVLKLHSIDLEQCIKSDAFYRRAAVLIGTSEALTKAAPEQPPVPYVVFRDNVITPNDRRGLRQLEQFARQRR